MNEEIYYREFANHLVQDDPIFAIDIVVEYIKEDLAKKDSELVDEFTTFKEMIKLENKVNKAKRVFEERAEARRFSQIEKEYM